jgi:ribosomal protein S12 methylthiotransferase accessory factor
MLAGREREVPVQDALDAIYAEFDRRGLKLQLITIGNESVSVIRCDVLDENGVVLSESAGKGGGKQTYASALFEAWEHHSHRQGLDELRHDRAYARTLAAGEVVTQPALARDAMLHRLAADFPRSRVGCLRFDRLPAGADQFPAGANQLPAGVGEVWYPAFVKCPWYQQLPIPGDDMEYRPYLRYASNNGTAAGTTEAEALLHGLMEVIERDALSIAFLDWYMTSDAPPRKQEPTSLTADLRELYDDVGRAVGEEPLIFNITTELGFPVFFTVPARPTYLGVKGSGASMIPSYALERALSELVQVHVNTRDLGLDHALRGRLANLDKWPRLARCVVMDPVDLAARAVPMPDRPQAWWTSPEGDVTTQFNRALGVLARSGFTGYRFGWNDGTTSIPVLTVLVPGMEEFFLSQKGIPILPTGRRGGTSNLRLPSSPTLSGLA